MCRFAVVLSKNALDLGKIWQSFANLSKNTPAPDGDAQEDGWGMILQQQDQVFQILSTKAIWKDNPPPNFGVLKNFRLFLHTRSATYKSQKSRIDLNQPFVSGDLTFVFNGRISGVSFPKQMRLYGDVGARRFFSLIQRFYKNGFALEQAISRSVELLKKRSRRIYGLNFAVADKRSLCVYSTCSESEDYYRLFLLERPDFLLISSAPGLDLENIGLERENYQKIDFGRVMSFNLQDLA